MSRDSSGRSKNPRMALGDLTNQLGKRGFSLISPSPASKSGTWNAKNINKKNDSQLEKRGSLGCQNQVVQVSGPKCPKVANADKPLPLLKGGKTYRLLSLGNADTVLDSDIKVRNQMSSVEDSLDPFRSGNALLDVVERGGIKGSYVFTDSVSQSCRYDIEIGVKSKDPEQKDVPQATQKEPLPETLGSQTASTDGKDSGFSTLPSTQCPPFLGSRLSKLKGTKPFELGRCKWLKGDPNSSSVADADLIKSCSCSFCVKAAYIWSDLLYMDAKGRISALLKSKKDASNLVRMYSVDNDLSSRGRETSSSCHSGQEIDLMNRCKSLFVCTEDIFGKECKQLETEIVSLKDVRENFKMSLGSIDTDVQHSASDPAASKKIN